MPTAPITFDITVEFSGEPGCMGALQAFSIGTQRVAVVEVLDRWHGADYCYIKVRGEDDALYIVRHAEPDDRWEMTLFQAPPAPPPGDARRLLS